MYCHATRQNIYMPGMQSIPSMQNIPNMQVMPGVQSMPGMQMMPAMQMTPVMQSIPSMQAMPSMQQMASDSGEQLYDSDVAVSPFLMAGVQPPETPVFNTDFTQGYLATQIGSKVRVEFLIGTNSILDRRGTLMHVGISFIIIQEEDTDDMLLCDIYSIKFVTFYK